MKRIALDIETIPLSLGAEKWEDDDRKKAALDAVTGRVVCIGCICVDGFKANKATALVSQDERQLLVDFWNLVANEGMRGFIAHNGLSFDLPFLWRRSVILNVEPTIDLDLRRYRNDFIFDTMNVWSNWEWRGSTSLDVLAEALGLGHKDGTADGVFRLWTSGRYEELGRYCLHDCWLTYGCFCRMNFRNPIAEETIATEVNIHTMNEYRPNNHSMAGLIEHTA